MIDDYYQTYKQMVAENTPDAKQNAAKKICKTWSNLAEQKGSLFSVLLALYLIYTFTVPLLLIFQVIKSVVLSSILVAIWILLPIILSKMDDKWREQSFFLNVFYFDSIERAIKMKMALMDKFKFDSAAQYQMILEEAERQNAQLCEEIGKQRQKAEQIMLGGILGSVLAFIPAIITGLMDNVDKTEAAQKNLTYIATGAFIILMIFIVFFSLLYLGNLWEIWKHEKEYRDYSDFYADMKMLVEIEAGLHPSAKELQRKLCEKKEEPQS